jgi:hypothetical protein
MPAWYACSDRADFRRPARLGHSSYSMALCWGRAGTGSFCRSSVSGCRTGILPVKHRLEACATARRNGRAHFAVPWEQNVPVPLPTVRFGPSRSRAGPAPVPPACVLPCAPPSIFIDRLRFLSVRRLPAGACQPGSSVKRQCPCKEALWGAVGRWAEIEGFKSVRSSGRAGQNDGGSLNSQIRAESGVDCLKNRQKSAEFTGNSRFLTRLPGAPRYRSKNQRVKLRRRNRLRGCNRSSVEDPWSKCPVGRKISGQKNEADATHDLLPLPVRAGRSGQNHQEGHASHLSPHHSALIVLPVARPCRPGRNSPKMAKLGLTN